MRRPRALAKHPGTYGDLLPPTRSGFATLVTLDDADARTLGSGDTLFTSWHGGKLLTLTVIRVRDAAHGDGGSPQRVVVVDVACQLGEELVPRTFSPCDLVGVSVRKKRVAA